MKALARVVMIALVVPALATVGCGSRESAAKKKEGRQTPTAGSEKNQPPPAPTATVFLRGRVEGDRAVVEVVASSMSQENIHGAAFRLHWDPAKLAFDEAHASDTWSTSAIQLAKEGLPGELVVVWTEKGDSAGIEAKDETILGSIELTLKTRDRVDLAFRPERSTLRNASGAQFSVDWHGGQLAAQ